MKIFIFSALFLSLSASALDLNIAPGVRSYPLSASMEARLRQEYLLWGSPRREGSIDYGFVQPQFTVATHGLVEVGLNVYPISILEVGVGYSSTSRFYDTKAFNCDNYVCQGVVRRQRFTLRTVVGAHSDCGDLFAVYSYHHIRVSSLDDSKPLVDEVEVLALRPGMDTLQTHSLAAGLQRGNDSFGLYAKAAAYLEAKTKNESQYLFYRKKEGPWNYVGGLGRYASDFSDAGFSAYAMVSWTWGNTISLF